ncbi:MAG TPA: mechanosensitive ion channel domain-containing protein [Woeseiaceae bacterium]|nr:mechanosensitive ion channel domain-containing protein [Woeseiaceae bacterium]
MTSPTQVLERIHPALPIAAGLILLLVLAFVAHFAARFILQRVVRAFARRSDATWDDALAEEKVFARIAQVVPALIVYTGIGFVAGVPDLLVRLIGNLAMAWIVLMAALGISAALSAANRIYSVRPAARHRPIKGFVQLAKIVVFIVAAVLIVAALIDRSPALLLTGFGAMTAVLLLVFRDTILGLVASVQLTAQDMVRVGDWIAMPRYNANGFVIDVALHTVTVQNWDKTVTTIPTHALISDSFTNWRGMYQAGGRRIKRSVFIDVESIRFLSDAEITHLRGFALLREYIAGKEAELEEWNDRIQGDGGEAANQRRLTNIGTFRAYVSNYVKNHPGIHPDMTLMVRQLAPGPEGLPLEIYAFTRSTAWDAHEGTQGDIFDHLLAIISEFGLQLFQNPTGQDIRRAFPARQ